VPPFYRKIDESTEIWGPSPCFVVENKAGKRLAIIIIEREHTRRGIFIQELRHRMLNKLFHLSGIAIVFILGCSSEDPASNLPPGGQYFTVQVVNDSFIMYVTDPDTIRLATLNYQGRSTTFPSGRIERGHGGFNQPWKWHFIPASVRMVEASVEVCDGRPSYVEQHVDDYVAIGYCPWGARVVKIGR
jgi:hypothetical protein